MPAFPERTSNGSEPTLDNSPRVASKPADATQSGLLAKYGITAVPLTSYEWGGYRYTNAHDAIAAAKRGACK